MSAIEHIALVQYTNSGMLFSCDDSEKIDIKAAQDNTSTTRTKSKTKHIIHRDRLSTMTNSVIHGGVSVRTFLYPEVVRFCRGDVRHD